jgi:hypothetical protein
MLRVGGEKVGSNPPLQHPIMKSAALISIPLFLFLAACTTLPTGSGMPAQVREAPLVLPQEEALFRINLPSEISRLEARLAVSNAAFEEGYQLAAAAEGVGEPSLLRFYKKGLSGESVFLLAYNGDRIRAFSQLSLLGEGRSDRLAYLARIRAAKLRDAMVAQVEGQLLGY